MRRMARIKRKGSIKICILEITMIRIKWKRWIEAKKNLKYVQTYRISMQVKTKGIERNINV
jgi:hypothetical protein